MVHLLVKKCKDICAVLATFPDADAEQILAVDMGTGLMPLIFEEGSEDHLQVFALARQAKTQMPEVKLEVVRFASREHMSWIEKEDSDAE